MKFTIPPEYCLIVNAFSQASTLRGAAQLLGTDPAALVRKVQRISQEYGLLEKVGNRWAVTAAGQKLAYWTEETINSQKLVIEESPRLRVSAYTWLTEEMLVPHFHALNVVFKEEFKWSFQMSGSDLEQDLLNNRTDFVIHGKAPEDPNIAHKRVGSFPWVAVAPYSWKDVLSKIPSHKLIEFLDTQKFCRHSNLNPVTVLNYTPSQVHDLILDGVIGLRSAVINELGWSALPAMAIQTALKEKKLIKLKLPIQFGDDVSIWWMRSRKDAAAYAKQIALWIQKFEVY